MQTIVQAVKLVNCQEKSLDPGLKSYKSKKSLTQYYRSLFLMLHWCVDGDPVEIYSILLDLVYLIINTVIKNEEEKDSTIQLYNIVTE